MDHIESYWDEFLKEKSPSNKKYHSAFSFGSSSAAAENLLKLVLKGKKTATCSALEEFQLNNEEIPKVGDYSIVLNAEGVPKCIIETTSVLFLKFEDMTYEICKREGEDENLESWQKNHINFFTVYGARLGYNFSWNMDIVFEDFKVVYR